MCVLNEKVYLLVHSMSEKWTGKCFNTLVLMSLEMFPQ